MSLTITQLNQLHNENLDERIENLDEPTVSGCNIVASLQNT